MSSDLPISLIQNPFGNMTKSIIFRTSIYNLLSRRLKPKIV